MKNSRLNWTTASRWRLEVEGYKQVAWFLWLGGGHETRLQMWLNFSYRDKKHLSLVRLAVSEFLQSKK